MPFLVMTRAGWQDLLDNCQDLTDAVWAAKGVLTADEIREYREMGVALTVLPHVLSHEDDEKVLEAMDDIETHHPGRSIWVEFPPADDEQTH